MQFIKPKFIKTNDYMVNNTFWENMSNDITMPERQQYSNIMVYKMQFFI